MLTFLRNSSKLQKLPCKPKCQIRWSLINSSTIETVENSSLKINWKDWQCLQYQYNNTTTTQTSYHGTPQPNLPHVVLISSTQGKWLEPKKCSMFSSCLLLTFQDNFHLYQWSIALLPASIRKHHFKDLYSHCGKADSLSSLTVDSQCLDWTPTKERKEPAVDPPPVTGTQCWHTSGDTCAAGARAAVPSICQEHHLPSFLFLAGPLWSLSTRLCNWSAICKKHRPTHAHGPLTQDTPWTVRWGNTAGSRQKTIYLV